MKERNRFETELRDLGICTGRNQVTGLMFGARTRATVRVETDGAEKEFDQPQPQPRLSSKALGDAFADFQAVAGVPDGAVLKLAGSEVFKNWIANKIDNLYVSLDKLMSSNQPGDMSEDGLLTKGSFRKRRVLQVLPTASTIAFTRARTIDNPGTADIVTIPAPPQQTSEKRTEQDWIMRILFMAAQVRNEAMPFREGALAKRNKSARLTERIKGRVLEQSNVRKIVDRVLEDIDRRNKGYGIGTLFDKLAGSAFIEISYHPIDLLVDGPLTLTNLEHYALAECMEEARRQKKLTEADVDKLKTQMDAKPLPADIAGLGKELEALKPLFAIQRGKPVLSGFENFYFARRLIDRRWRLFDPVDAGHKPWETNKEVAEMRQEHAQAVFPQGLKYMQ